MVIEAGKTGVLSFGDGSKSRVKLVEIEYSKSGMFPTDYWLEYAEDETHRPLVHPDFGKNDIIKTEILLPEFLFQQVFTLDEE